MLNKSPIFLLLVSSISSAAHFGTYETVPYQIPNLNTQPQGMWGSYVYYQGMINGTGKYHFLCTDTSSRKTPGRVTETTCEVEWRGKEYFNSDFRLLRNDGYSWMQLTATSKATIMQRGVTPGVVDEGNYVYHCKIRYPVSGGNSFAGKYIPSRDGCYYGWFGDGKFVHMNNSDLAQLEVLVK